MGGTLDGLYRRYSRDGVVDDRLRRPLDSRDGARVDRFYLDAVCQIGKAGRARQGARDIGERRTSMNSIAVGVAWTRKLIGGRAQQAPTNGRANGGGVAGWWAAAIWLRDRPHRPRPRLRAIRVAGRPGPIRSGSRAPSIHRRDRVGRTCGFGAPLPNTEVREAATSQGPVVAVEPAPCGRRRTPISAALGLGSGMSAAWLGRASTASATSFQVARCRSDPSTGIDS
jgi:hypothetical protein